MRKRQSHVIPTGERSEGAGIPALARMPRGDSSGAKNRAAGMTWTLRALAIAALIAACGAAHAATLADCQDFAHHGRTREAQACYRSLASSPDPYLRAEAAWGLSDFQTARDEFEAALKRAPNDPNVRVRYGRMLLERFNPKDAADLFNEALEKKPNDPPALLGLALVGAESFDHKAVELAQQALAGDPKLVEAQELLARLALEEDDPQKAAAEADKALAISPEALDAMAIHATVDWLANKKDTSWMDRLLKINPAYGEGY